jgi:hypothetical protein
MALPSLSLSEVVLIIGKRQGQSSYDCIAIIPKTTKFQFTDPPIAIPIPSTSTSTAVDTKLVPLRRVTRKVTITGIIVDGNDTFSKYGITLNDSTGAITNGTGVTSVLGKKWYLEEMFNQGAAGEGMTVQWRGVIIPSANPQTSPPTAPSDETKNMLHKMGKIIDLTITDDAATPTSPQSSFTKYFPEKMDISITIQWGSVQT